MTFSEAQEYIASFVNFELSPVPYPHRCVFKLERVRRLLALLGDPQNHLKIIHVAGSKGKGSVCALTAAVLQKAGYRVGLYTSPHLGHYRERIRVVHGMGGQGIYPPSVDEENIFPDMISEADLCQILDILKPTIEQLRADEELGPLSFFELFTVMAFYYFYQRRVDWTVVETGMGGRLDATNIAPSSICAITSLSLEHTLFLGNTLAQIAREKAGIIKDRCQRVVIAPQENEAREVLREHCARLALHPLWIGEDIKWQTIRQDINNQVVSFSRAKRYYPHLELSLRGQHQVVNAAVAFGIIESLRDGGTVIDDEALRHGLRHAFWPGRIEIVGKDPLVILDCAHNPASALNLVESLQSYLLHRTVILVLGISEDKDILGICRQLDRIVSRVVATRADHPRAHIFREDELKTLFPGKSCLITPNIQQALEHVAGHALKEDVVLITGSIFLVGQVRRYLCLHHSI